MKSKQKTKKSPNVSAKHVFGVAPGSIAVVSLIMHKHLNQTIYAFILCALLLIISVCLATLSIYLLDKIGLFEHSTFADKDYRAQGDYKVREVFARLFLLWPIMLFYGPLILSKAARSWFISERWILITLILFALGAAFAMGDPLHGVRNEGNWIRYWTAGVLGVAGVIAVVISLSAEHPLPDRLFGGLFGLLLVAAASDELFEFHEQAGSAVDGFLPSGVQVPGQDMVTLAVAVFGAIALVSAVLVWRFMPWSKSLYQEPRYRRTFSFFALAVVIFSTAMVLDAFDWYLEHLTDQLWAPILGHSELNEAPRWLGGKYISHAANSLEELLEYLAAIFLLMMIGTLFSVKALGFGLQSSLRGVRAQLNC